MTIIKAEQITEDNIKCRWEEPYVSSAINRLLSALPRGVYRGFVVEEMGTPGSGITITPDTYDDSFLLHEMLSTGFKTAVRYDAAFNVTFTFTNGVTYYVWVDVDYQVSSATSGYIRVGEAADFAAATNAVVIATFNAAGGVINDADITQDPVGPPISFLTPVPDTSEKNYWGMLDQTRFDRLPDQNEKNAMVAANAPTTGNPFATIADQPTDIPLTYVVSDGVRSTGGDFDGPTGIVDALTALNGAGVPGDIYVRRGEYTLSTSLSVVVPVRIYCEGHDGQAIGTRCLLAMSNAASWGLSFSAPAEIHSLETTVTTGDGVRFLSDGLLVDCTMAGATTYSTARGGGALRCNFDSETTLSNSFFLEIKGCAWVLPNGGYCIGINGGCGVVRITDCSLDGIDVPSGPTYSDGGGIRLLVGADFTNFVIEGCTFYSNGAFRAIALSTTGSVKDYVIRNCKVIVAGQYGSVSSLAAVDLFATSNSTVEVDGISIEVSHSDEIDSGLFTFYVDDDSVRVAASIRNVVVRGNGNVVANSTSSNAGMVTVVIAGIDSASQVTRVENMVVSNFRGNQANANSAILVAAQVSAANNKDSKIVFDGLIVSGLSGTAISAAAYLIAFAAALSSGSIIVQNSTIDGKGLDNSFTGNYRGINVPSGGAVKQPGTLYIINSLVSGWSQNDVHVADITARILINGLRHEGNADVLVGNTGARIFLEATNWAQVMNCYYDDIVGGPSGFVWLYVGSTSIKYGSFMGNMVNMANAADDAIYCLTTTGPFTFIGNGGVGQIDVWDADNHIGVGASSPAGSFNLNTLDKNLRT